MAQPTGLSIITSLGRATVFCMCSMSSKVILLHTDTWQRYIMRLQPWLPTKTSIVTRMFLLTSEFSLCL